MYSIAVPDSRVLPSSKAEQVLAGSTSLYRPGPNVPWGDPIEKKLQQNRILHGVRGKENFRVNYVLSDFFPGENGILQADLEIYRPVLNEGSDLIEMPIRIEGIENVVELISGQAAVLLNGSMHLPMEKDILYPVDDSIFTIVLTGRDAVIRVGVPFTSE